MFALGTVTLTKMEEKDIEMVRAWRNNPKVYTQLVDRREITAEQQQRWFDTRDWTQEYYFIANRNGHPFGLVYARHYDGTQAETGIFVSSDAMGLPYGLVAAYALICYCFDVLKCKKLIASHFPTNTNVMKSDKWFGYDIIRTDDIGLIWSELTSERYQASREEIIRKLERL